MFDIVLISTLRYPLLFQLLKLMSFIEPLLRLNVPTSDERVYAIIHRSTSLTRKIFPQLE